jgi:hypothetical protein
LDKHKLGEKVCNTNAHATASSLILLTPLPLLPQDRKAQNSKWLKKWKLACFIISALYFVLKFLCHAPQISSET